MEVYILTQGREGIDEEVLGVFSTKQRAADAAQIGIKHGMQELINSPKGFTIDRMPSIHQVWRCIQKKGQKIEEKTTELLFFQEPKGTWVVYDLYMKDSDEWMIIVDSVIGAKESRDMFLKIRKKYG